MAKMAEQLKAKGVTREDNGAVLVDFKQLLPGKEGKQLGVTLVRCVRRNPGNPSVIADNPTGKRTAQRSISRETFASFSVE